MKNAFPSITLILFLGIGLAFSTPTSTNSTTSPDAEIQQTFIYSLEELTATDLAPDKCACAATFDITENTTSDWLVEVIDDLLDVTRLTVDQDDGPGLYPKTIAGQTTHYVCITVFGPGTVTVTYNACGASGTTTGCPTFYPGC